MAWSSVKDDFVIGKDDFNDLQINPAPDKNFYYFQLVKGRRLIKQFVLERKERVDRLCRVALIQNGHKFEPRLAFSIRDRAKEIQSVAQSGGSNIKANVDLSSCHENLWRLISYLQSLEGIEVPTTPFSLISHKESQIVEAIKLRGADSIGSIIKELSTAPGVTLTKQDIGSLLRRKEKLNEFEMGLTEHASEESWWQDFFEDNKWIFGYGLNYRILREEQSQPVYGGQAVDGKGAQIGDLLMSSCGDLNFTVLVEIKTPSNLLLHGSKEIRSGAWSLSQSLTDAISQLQANIRKWETVGSQTNENKDLLESRGVHTVKPKGILVIGRLSEFGNIRSKRETFQCFRESMHGIDVLSFDELLRRAQYIAKHDVA